MKKIKLSEHYTNPIGDDDEIEVDESFFELFMLLFHEWRKLVQRENDHRDKRPYEEGTTELISSGKMFTLEDIVVHEDDIRRLRETLSQLTEVQRRRVQAYFFEDQSYREIALRDGVSIASVYESLHAVYRKLRKALE